MTHPAVVPLSKPEDENPVYGPVLPPDYQNRLLESPAEGSWCGRAWKWVVDYIFIPIYEFFRSIFCCCCKKPEERVDDRARSPGPRLPVRPTPIVALDPPAHISNPCPTVPDALWPQETSISKGLKHFLTHLATSDEARDLLREANTTVATPRVLSHSARARNHLSAIVEKLRNPDTNSPLQKKHLEDLEYLLLGIPEGVDRRRNPLAPILDPEDPFEILLKLAYKFECLPLLESINPKTHPLMNANLAGPILHLEGLVAEVNQISEDALPELPFFSEVNREKVVHALLMLLASNQCIDRWITTSFVETPLVLNGNETPLLRRTKEIEHTVKHIERRQLQEQFKAIIHRIRTSTVAGSSKLTSEDIRTFLQLIKKIDGKALTYKVESLLLTLCKIFGYDEVDFQLLYQLYLTTDSKYVQIVSFGEEPLTPGVGAVIDSAIPNLSTPDEDKQRALCALLTTLSANHSNFDQILTRQKVSQNTPNRGPHEPDSVYFERKMLNFVNITKVNSLKEHLIGIINRLRVPQDDSRLTSDHITCLLRLLEANNCFSTDPIEMLTAIFKKYRNVDDDQDLILLNSIRPLLWEQVKDIYLYSDNPLPMVDHRLISRPLPNIGSTCYLNSVLQMIARLPAYDSLLKDPITLSLPSQLPGEATEDYQNRCQRTQREFEETNEPRNALQLHLKEVIATLRTDPGIEVTRAPIERETLRTLYKLLQINGWNYLIGSEQDPYELITFLARIFNATASNLNVITETLKSSDKTIVSRQLEVNGEIQLSLPTTEELLSFDEFNQIPTFKTKLRDEYSTFADLLDYYLCDSNTRVDFRPENSTEAVECERRHRFKAPAPQILFVSYKRFDYDLTTHLPCRLNCQVPFSPEIELPLYGEDDSSPIVQKYRLRVVIGHLGNNASSGHYTTFSLQTYGDAEAWIHYNDEKLTRLPNDSGPHSPQIQNMIKERAYFMAYERIDDTDGGDPAGS